MSDLSYVEIESIEEYGVDETYDIWNYDERCQDSDGGNFFIDGVLVHNSIPEAVKNRDDKSGAWQSRLKRIHPILLDVLEKTYGVLCYQEQLAALWQLLAGFTAPEAQDARKAVAKKHTQKLKGIERKWIDGATPNIGKDNAVELWSKMVTFGRYAFNLSHAVSYCLRAYQCFWLKAHFAPEWWAAVMSDCKQDKLIRYMGVARAEQWIPSHITNSGSKRFDSGMKFGTINIENLDPDFTVTGNEINQGLIGIKGIGEGAAKVFSGTGKYADIDEFVAVDGHQSKTVMERFIKLRAFQHLPGHDNAKALWMWYQYKYCKSGKDMTALRNEIKAKLLLKDGWNQTTIKDEINRQTMEFRRQYPKRNKIPPKIVNWKPPVDDTRERVMSLYQDDFTMSERLDHQKEFFGYWIDSPLELYRCSGVGTIASAKEAAKNGQDVILEGIIVDAQEGITKTKKPFLKVFLTDGVQRCLVFVWSTELAYQDLDIIKEGIGVTMVVDYDEKRSTFSLARNEIINKLVKK